MAAALQTFRAAALVLFVAQSAAVTELRGSGHGAASASATSKTNAAIVPELHPRSDKVFFGHDYPDDMRPEGRGDFQYPHPIVQESDEYDKDYPKDENADSGEWKAQYDYDTLRARIAKAKKAAAMATREEFEEEARLKAAQAAKERAEKEAAAAEARAAAKRKAIEDAQKAAEAAERDANGKYGDADGNAVNRSVDMVEERIAKLDECKKELAKAQAHLKKLMAENEAREKDKNALEKESDAAAKEAYQKAMEKGRSEEENAKKELTGIEAKVAKAEKDAEEASKNKEEVDKRQKYKKEAFEEAAKDYEASKKELAQMEKDLEKAEKVLREFRHKQAGTDGGVYVTPAEKKYDPCEGCNKGGSLANLDSSNNGATVVLKGDGAVSPGAGSPSAAPRSVTCGIIASLIATISLLL